MSSSRLDHHTPDYQNSIGNFNLSYHLEMLKDSERVNQIKAALDETLLVDGIHCELGIGTGIFAIYAAQRCQKVLAIERDPAIFKIAKKNIEASGYKHKIELVLIDALNYRPAIKADTLLVEMMSIWCINEPQVAVMNHAIKHILKKGGQAIPRKIINLVELGNFNYHILGVECKASIPQFTGLPKPRIMTTSTVFNTFDLLNNNNESIHHSIQLTALLNGKINCARLTSLVQMSENVTFYSTDSLMPQTIIPLNEIEVKAGSQLVFSADFEVRSSLDESVFKLTFTNE